VYLDGIELREVDVRDADAMDALIRDVRPDEVYQLAGITSFDHFSEHRELVAEVNDHAVGNLLASCRRYVPDARVFLASSAEVFGPEVEGRCSESTPLDPRGPYAVSKARVHAHAAEARSAGQFAAVGILFNHESQIRGRSFVTRKVARAVAAMACGSTDRLVLGNLDVSRDWGAAGDTVDAMIRMVRADEPREVVVATGTMRTVRELVDAASDAVGLDDAWSRVDQDPALMRMADSRRAVADTTLANEWLGWRPRTSFEGLVATMVRTDVRRIRSGVEESPEYLD